MNGSVEYYRDFTGCTASIRKRAGGYHLKAKTPGGVITICSKLYKTYIGAKIALGKIGSSWQMTERR